MRFKKHTYSIENSLSVLLLLLLCLSGACKKADEFYDKLQVLPQIDYSINYGYKSAYVIGDTMVISGRLQPENNLKISIGGVAVTIVKMVTLQTDTINEANRIDRVSLLITAAMEGKAREVEVTSSGYTTTGNPIDVYSAGGLGSFTDSLKSVLMQSFTSNKNIFFYCANGKGDVYYYAPDTKDIRHVKKDGSEQIVYDLSGNIITGTSSVITAFLAGGVDPLGRTLFLSVQMSSGYRLMRLDLKTNQLGTLNQSSRLTAPYEGIIGSVNLIATGIYPDSKGNLYLSVGLGNNILNQNSGEQFYPDAIAKYSADSHQLSYIFKGISQDNFFADMPGIRLGGGQGSIRELKFSPDENLLYLLESASGITAYIEIYDLTSRTKLQDFSTVNTLNTATRFDAIAPFSGLHLDIGGVPGQIADNAFGYMPMPGRRLQTLLYQYVQGQGISNLATQYGFPKWIVFDFAGKRTYAYAPGRFSRGNYLFQPSSGLSPKLSTRDELLNYDEQGNLYMTTNGKLALIKTQTVH